MHPKIRLSFPRVVTLSILAAIASAHTATAQTLGTFRWRTEPFCNVLNLTVTQNGSTFTLDGFDEPCGGNPRLPVHGIAVPQPNGTLTLGLSVVHNPGNLTPVNLEAVISPSTVSGTWRDNAGGNGALTFNPVSTPGDSRPGAVSSGPLPTQFDFLPNGAFAAVAGAQNDPLPASGAGKRLVWHAAKGAFRAGQVDADQWNDNNIGLYSAAFGYNTYATGLYSFAAGVHSAATNGASVALGSEAVASGPAAIALGFRVTAGGFGSVVLGSRGAAEPTASGSFIFADSSTANTFTGVSPNQFLVRADGGVTFFSSASLQSGVSLYRGAGSWTTQSDVNTKENFRDLGGDDVLAKLARMPIREWSYKTQDASVRHAGPTAQDFHAAFGLGEDPLRISTVDADGIALRAIQALEARTRELRDVYSALSSENHDRKAEITALRTLLEETTKTLAAITSGQR